LFREQVRGFGRADPLVMNERLDCFQLGGRWVEVPVAGLFALRG
jgi:limonene-1,2-epoxide hydrolase